VDFPALQIYLLNYRVSTQAVGSFPETPQATGSLVRVTNLVVSANKTTQVGASFGEADLPYEQGARTLVPRSSKGGFPLQSHSDSSHSKDMRVIKASSVTIANDKRRVKPS